MKDLPNKKYNIYVLKESDTIKSIAKFLGKTEWEIYTFHNLYANQDEVMSVEFGKDQKILFITPDFTENDINLVPKVIFESGSILRFNPSFKKLNYGVMNKIIMGNNISKIDYEVSVQCIEKLPQQNFLFEINRISKVFLDDKETDNILDQLAEKVSEVIYPLVILVNEHGILNDIYNVDEIKKRWQNKKEKIFDEYQGEDIENYLRACELNFESKSNLKSCFINDWFLNVFFNGIYFNYYDNLSFKSDIFIPIVTDTTPVKYQITSIIDKYLDENGNINIEQNGILFDSRTKDDLQNGISVVDNEVLNGNVTGNYNSKYFLSPVNNKIKSLFVECNIELDEPKKIEIIISLINEIEIPTKIIVKETEEEILPKKKKGWLF